MTARDALTTLERMPAWPDLDDPAQGPGAEAAVETACARLAELDDDALRDVVARYVEAERAAHGELGVDAAGRLYVLARYVYAAPVRVEPPPPRFGGFAGVPHGDGWIDEAWPWADDGGRLRLVGSFGGYFGDEYRALDELDALRETYGRRGAR
ncbi:hypothetical protein [Isoptericola sp. NPDC057653]|uniref:hypothetical protein n=1 Tax=Isoptericola sp. NPDC057653 TaxID=3346195 RepID=UPI00368AD73C